MMPKKDKQKPVITYVSIPDGFEIQYGQTSLAPIYLNASDNVGIFQKVYQIDPEGPTYPAGPEMEKNKSFWGATDLWEVNKYTADISELERGPHILRYTVYDKERNSATKEITFHII